MSTHDQDNDEMREEYDFSQSRRAPYAALAGDVDIVVLEPDVAKAFPDSESVNTALRVLLQAARRAVELPKAS